MNKSTIEAGQPEQVTVNEQKAELLPSAQVSANAMLAAVRVNDVYSFRYNEEETKKRFEPYHCFDGQFVVKKKSTGELYLEDTYWGYGDNKVYDIETALKNGYLTFKCNLDEVEPINKHEIVYYADEDIFDLSTQHHCRINYVKRKCAERSKGKMLASIKYKIEEAESKKCWAENALLSLKEKLEKVEAGDTAVYI